MIRLPRWDAIQSSKGLSSPDAIKIYACEQDIAVVIRGGGGDAADKSWLLRLAKQDNALRCDAMGLDVTMRASLLKGEKDA